MAKRFWGILAGVILGVAATAGGASAMGDKIVVASKIDTEGALLGNIIVLLEADFAGCLDTLG